MYIKTFLNKLGGAFTRILILVLVLSMLIPMELLSVMDLGEDGTATSNAYSIVAGNSGSVATHGLPNSCGIINNFKCGFKVGVVFDDGMLVDAKHSVENLIIENGRGFTMIDSGTFILPQSLTKENKWVVGYYDASSMDIAYKPENLDKITFTNGTNSKPGKVDGTGHVFYKEILDSMKKDEGAFMSKDWQTILEKGPTNKNKCLDNWEYLLGWSGKSFAINSRFNECFNKDENGFENISEWGGDKEKVLDEKANYLDMLYQLYTISGSEPIKTNIKKAIEILVKDEFASNPFGLVIQPLVVLGPMDRYGTTMVINTNDFLQYICGITSSNGLTRPQFENYIMNEKPDLAGSYYGMLREATNKSIREHPTAFREADEWQGYPDHHVVWDWASTGVGWKSIKLSKVIVPGRYPNVGWNWGTAGSTDADMHESAWLNAWINSSNIDATMDPNGHKDFKGMYGLNIVYYVNGVAAEASLGKLQALPDEKVVHKTQEDTHFGEVVDLKLFTGVDNEKERAEWANIIKLAKEDKSFAGFHITAKLSRTTDVPEWKGLPTNFLTDWEDPKINNIKAEVMDEMIKGNTPILQNTDDISSYPVPKGEKAVLHYKADVLVTAKIGDKDYKWKISPASDGMDDASFIIDNKATKKERIRYISTQTAFAELKNYGKGSNQSGNLSETYEVMAGVPTTEQLYYAAGGSEFIVDVSLEYCNNEKAVRSYVSHYAGTSCEFKDRDQAKKTWTVPSYSGGLLTGSDYSLNIHNGDLRVNVTISGTINNDATAVTALHSASCPAQPNPGDLADRAAAYQSLVDWTKAAGDFEMNHMSASDLVNREATVRKIGSLSLPGCPSNIPASTSASVSCAASGGGSHPPPCGNEMATASPGGPVNWSVTATWTIKKHALCGPCCCHELPGIYDTWSQSFQYDSLKITDVHVWRIDQASASNLEEVIGPAVDNNVRYSLNPVTNTEGAYENPNAVEDGIVGASIKTNPPNIFYNIAMKNSNDIRGNDPIKITYKTEDGMGKATESSLVGRLRYNVNTNWADASQHDEVYYDLKVRTNKCDGMAKTYDENIKSAGGKGHKEKWGTGFIYTEFQAEPTVTGTTSSKSVHSGDVQSNKNNYWQNDATYCGQTLFPLNDYNYLKRNTDGADAGEIEWGGTASTEKNTDTDTVEYKGLLEKRSQPTFAAMITDFLILQTTSGDQSVMYYMERSDDTELMVDKTNNYLDRYKEDGTPQSHPNSVTKVVTAEMKIPTTQTLQKTMWDENIKGRGGEYFGECASNWDPNEINIGGYNGNYRSPGNKFVGSGDGHHTKTLFDGADHATGAHAVDGLSGVIVRPTKPARPLMLYSLPINIITEIENKQYLVDGLESEVFWTNNLHWSDMSSESYSVNTNPMAPDYSVTSHKEDARFEFSNHKDLITTWGQDNSNVANSYRGIIDDTHYSPNHAMELNGLVIQDQISTTDSSLISLPNSRDQRYAEIIGAKDNNADLSKYQVCPETAEECEFAILKCHYGEGKKVAEYLFNLNNGLNSVTENSFNAATGWSFSNNKLVGSVGAKKIGIPLLTELDSSMNAGMKLGVSGTINLSELPVTRNPNGTIKTRISQMIWSFKGYGLYVSTEGKLGFITSKGQYRESTNVVLQKNRDYNIEAVMSFSGLQTCSLKVDGVDVTFTSSSKKPVKFDTSVIGEYFYFGCTGDNKCEYGFRGTMDNIVITRMPGTYNHTADCYTTTMIHPSGLNVHVHSKECLNTKDDVTTTTTVVVANPGTVMFTSSTAGSDSVTLEKGTYTVTLSGASGGTGLGSQPGGSGACIKGTLNLSSRSIIGTAVGGAGGDNKYDGGTGSGGINGGAQALGSHGGGGGGKSHISLNGTILAAAGGGGGGSHNSGAGGAGSTSSVAYGSGGSGGDCVGAGAGGYSYYGGLSSVSAWTGNRGSGSVTITAASVITKVTEVVVKDNHGYAYYKDLYKKGQISIEQLKALFGDAFELLFNDAADLESITSFNKNNFSNFYNCDLNVFSGELIQNITGTAPSFVMNKAIEASKVSKIRVKIDNNTKAKKAKIYWSNNGVFSENNSCETVMIPNGGNQTLNFYVDKVPGWSGRQTMIKFCIPYESDINYGNDITYKSISFERALEPPVNFQYTGSVQTFTTDVGGKYLLETWGASGGNASTSNSAQSAGGRGGYSAGVYNMSANSPLYVYVGGQGSTSPSIGTGGGYNGGGHGGPGGTGGGGMTHISTSSSDSISSTVGYVTETIETGTPAGTLSGTCTYGGNNGGSWTDVANTNWTSVKSFVVKGYGKVRFWSDSPAATNHSIDPVARIKVNGAILASDDDGGDGYNFDLSTDVRYGDFVSYEISSYRSTGGTVHWNLTHPGISTSVTTTTIKENDSIRFNTGAAISLAGGGGGADNSVGTFRGGDDGSGGFGGGVNAGGGYINGSLQPSTAASSTSGYKQGLGQGATVNTDTGGAGGGWWGGRVTNHYDGGAGGGSGHNSSSLISYTARNGKTYNSVLLGGDSVMPSFLSDGTMQGNVGNGHARITMIESGNPEFPTIEEIIEVIDKIPENSDLVNCDRTPNTHKCDALCKEIEVLECVEPHHLGNHYQNDELCYDACMDDAKHKTSDPANTTNGMFTPGNFINIDWGYLIYYMNKGDFFQSDAHGIGNLTNTRGIGYENDMDTSTWTKIKRVRFDWNAIYEDHLYLAGEWIILADKGDYQGTDGSPYNERNWSNFGTKLYDDLYGNLLPTGAGEDRNHDGILDPVNEAVRSREGKYQFYCVEGNAEAAGARTSISAYAINNVPEWSDCADDASFDQYTTNRIRQGKRYQSMHSAYNEFYIDVVGRIGNFALIDTGDYRFSNLFKETTSSTADAVPDPTVYSVVDKSIVPTNEATIIGDDTISTKSAGSGAALLNKQLEVGNYRLSINGTGLLNSALSVKSKNAWEALEDIVSGAGMESTVVEDLGSGPNADEFIPASFTSTVTGPGSSLPAGEYNIQMVGAGMFAATWTVMDGATDITAYVEDMSVTDDLIVIRLNTPVKINNLQLSTVYKGNKEVTVDRVMISRLMENANKELTATDAVTNVAVTNTLRTYNILIKEPTAVDITSISVGLPLTVTSMSIQKISDNDESWTVEGIVRNVDESKQNAYLTWKFDIRGLPVSQATTLNIDTYSTLNWAQTRPIMPTICMTTIPLDASQNNIDVLKKEAVLVGYDAFASIGTIGNYYQNGSGFLQAIPEYYAVNVNTGEFTPVDAYIYYDNAYYPINIWGMVTNEDKLTWGDKGSGYDMNSIYNFVSTLDWDNEKDRRMVTAAEVFETNALREAFGVVSGGPDTGEPIKYLNIPMSSKYVMGNSQFLQLNGKARTFVGGETTYGTLMNYSFGGRDSSVISTDQGTGMLYNKEGRLDKEIWWKQAQRWHLKIGLPSSAVFVDSGVTPDANTIAKIQSKDYVVLSTVDIRALGDTWNLRYVQENGSINVSTKDGTVKQYDIPETITIGGKVHRIPAAITVYQTIKSSAVDVSIVGNH